jgi:acetylornithine deacetylase/succinyl-diaminopimelate desuccinylase-like protein
MGTWFDTERVAVAIDRLWEESVLPTLADYTRVPCLSPAFDPDWAEAGALARAAELLRHWCAARPIPGLSAEIIELPGRTPTLLVEVPATDRAAETVLVYGHLDKQPPQGEWRAGLGPFDPVRQGDRLYGRGTADDGYAVFAALSALEALTEVGAGHGRVLVLIEASEESGSPDLTSYLDALESRISRPRLVVCLDSGALTYDRIWVTSSLRGNVVLSVRVDVLDEGIHSGASGGGIPSSFRLMRQLLSRIEDEDTGEIRLAELHAEVPSSHRQNLIAVAAELGEVASGEFPTVPGLELGGSSEADRLIGSAWTPALSVIGVDGIPAVGEAGNVLRPFTTLTLSVRIPPTVDARRAGEALRAVLRADPPQGARVTVTPSNPADGWVAPDPEPWLAAALDEASRASFGIPAGSYGVGGSIPFLAELGRRFPGTQLVATGVLGPHSNAHGPNEFLHVPMGKAVTLTVAHLIAAACSAAPG